LRRKAILLKLGDNFGQLELPEWEPEIDTPYST
jgi:hypothetical protein